MATGYPDVYGQTYSAGVPLVRVVVGATDRPIAVSAATTRPTVTTGGGTR